MGTEILELFNTKHKDRLLKEEPGSVQTGCSLDAEIDIQTPGGLQKLSQCKASSFLSLDCPMHDCMRITLDKIEREKQKCVQCNCELSCSVHGGFLGSLAQLQIRITRGIYYRASFPFLETMT